MERPTFARQASDLPADSIAHSPTHSSDLNSDEKTGAESYDEKKGLDGEHFHPASLRSVRSEDIIDGHERPIETAEDLTQRCISLEDDPELPVHTLRMWVLGVSLTVFAGVLGQIFYFRPQTIYVSGLFIQILAFMLGKAWHKILPKASRGPFWAFLNPGDFNIKEAVAVTVMSSTASSSALAISVFAAEDLYYNITPSYAGSIFTLLGSQLFGYGIAGLARSFAVYPTYIVFPSLLPTVNLFDALYRDKGVLTQVKRIRFFWMVFIAIFCWEWFPEFIAPTLTGISVVCLAKRNSPWVTRLFGGASGNEGLGLFSLCFDWNYTGSGGGSLGALFTPFSTQISLYAGVGLCVILTCSLYASNVWNAQNFPFLSQELFGLDGSVYNQTAILNADNSLNRAALEVVGLPWYATSNALYYVGSNLAIGATFTHVFLWYMPAITKAFKQFRTGEQPDPHYQMMLKYPEVPMWWYGVTLVISFVMAMVTCYTEQSHLPWWALIIALGMAFLIFPFVVVILAITGFGTDVTQLAQLLGAALVPGNPQANMYFTLYAAHSVGQASHLTSDLKLGQYTKLPPRDTFIVQLVGTVIGAILQLVIMKSIISAQRDILLSVDGTNIWSGQQVQSFNSEAIAVGALVRDLYAYGQPYFMIPFSIVIGLFVPLPFYIAHRIWPRFGADRIVTPVMCWTLGYLSVGINSSVFTTMLIALFSQYYLRVKRPTWFRKYNYLLSAGLDGGTQFMVFVATFSILGGSGTAQVMPTWALNPDSAVYNPDYCMKIKST